MLKILPSLNDKNQRKLIEIQGDILHTFEESYENMTFGTIEEKQNVYTLLVGNHLLEGKLVKLKNPLILLKKQKGINMNDNELTKSTKELELKEIFYEKILFSSRPVPISCINTEYSLINKNK